jgi:Protease inhibitor Inh
MKRIGHCSAGGTKAAAIILCLGPIALGLSACTSGDRFGGGQPDQVSAPAPAPTPSPPSPPPVDLAGKWKLSAAGGGACVMTFGGSTGSSDGSIAPAGGCPLNFFTSRKWSYEHSMLVIRNHKGEVLVELSFANGHFEGQASGGGTVSLTR